MKDFSEKQAVKLSWDEVCRIVSDEIEEIIGIRVSCKASVVEMDFWALEFNDCRISLPNLCQLLQAAQAAPEDWEEALTVERETSSVRDIGMLLTQKLISRHLKLAWEHALSVDDSLWLIGVTEDAAKSEQNIRNRSDCSFPPELAQAIITIADRIRKQEEQEGID